MLTANGLGCPAEYNLADHAVWLTQTEPEARLAELSAKFHAALEQRASEPARVVSSTKADSTPSGAPVGHGQTPGFASQLWHLSRREALGWWRNKPAIIASIVIPSILNLIFSCVFYQVPSYLPPSPNRSDPHSALGSAAEMASGAQPR